jgi:hypothetical protein
VILYARATRARGRGGFYGFWSMVAVLTVLWVASLGGDPPPSLPSLAIVNTIFFVLLEAWAVWMNRSRPLLAPLRHNAQAAERA